LNIVASLWFLVAAIWAVIGTRHQFELSYTRLCRQEREAAETYTTIEEWTWEVPRWRFLRRRQLKREIEQIVRDDHELWERYQEMHKELSAWNLLESAAALVFGGSLVQAAAVWLDRT
jgi:hypothetical protein